MIMAIDPGIANLGYAIGKDNQIIESGIFYTTTKHGSDFERTYKMKQKILGLIYKYPIQKVYIEKYRVYGDPITRKGARHGEKTLRVIQSIEELLYEKNIHFEEIDTKTWRARYKKIWTHIVLSGKFPQIVNTMEKAEKKKIDHERDALKMLIPEIINIQKILFGGK